MSALMSALMPTTDELIERIKAATRDVERQIAALDGEAESAAPKLAKYTIVAWERGGLELPIVFSRDIPHRNMVPMGMTPISAGFVITHKGRVTVPGIGSETLKLDPRPRDREILANFLSLE